MLVNELEMKLRRWSRNENMDWLMLTLNQIENLRWDRADAMMNMMVIVEIVIIN